MYDDIWRYMTVYGGIYQTYKYMYKIYEDIYKKYDYDWWYMTVFTRYMMIYYFKSEFFNFIEQESNRYSIYSL